MKQTKNMIQQVKRLILIAVFALFTVVAFAQGPGDPGGDPSGESPPIGAGGGAHLGGGILILLTLGLAYGGKRLYDLKKEKKEEVA